jgi:hypothetical protein
MKLFKAHGEPAYSEASTLLSDVEHRMERSFVDCHSDIAALLHDNREELVRRVQRLRSTLNNRRWVPPSVELQTQVGQFCEDYEWCIRWVNHLGKLSRCPANLPSYDKWRQADREFIRALKETVSMDDMETLAKLTNENDAGAIMRQQIDARATEAKA